MKCQTLSDDKSVFKGEAANGSINEAAVFSRSKHVSETLLTLSPQSPSCAGLQRSHKLIPATERERVCALHIYHLCYQHMTNIYPDLITIHLLMPQRCRVWLFVVLNKHVVWNKRMHTVGVWNALPLLSESVTCEGGGARRWLPSTQEICWCRCLPKCVQYASLNHKVTI